MLKSLVRTAFIAVSLSAASVAFAQAMAPAKTADTSKGKTFVDAKGMTLYTFDKDVKWQIGLQWPLRHELAALHGGGGRQGIRRLDAGDPRRRLIAMGL